MSQKRITRQHLYQLVVVALLIAMNVVLARFCSVNTPLTRIGFSFVTVFISAALYGPVSSMLVSGAADFIGAMLFPTGYYFPGFTVTALIIGLISGLFLYKKQTLLRITLSVLVNQVVGTLLLNTLWLSIINSRGFFVLFTARLYQAAIMAAVQIVVGYLILVKSRQAFKAIQRMNANHA